MYVCMYLGFRMYDLVHVCICASMSACMCICMYVCVYERLYVCMYVRTYVCMYVCMYVCTHVCMYVSMYSVVEHSSPDKQFGFCTAQADQFLNSSSKVNQTSTMKNCNCTDRPASTVIGDAYSLRCLESAAIDAQSGARSDWPE